MNKQATQKLSNSRAIAAQICWQIIDQGRSLDKTLTDNLNATQLTPADRGYVQELVYGICRWYWPLDATAQSLLNSPIRSKERVIHFVLLIGLYQLTHLKTPDHAAVSESVNACQQLKKPWAKNLLNGCLRRFLREENLNAKTSPQIEFSHPQWLIQQIQRAWPEHYKTILNANNQRPPMCLRVNHSQSSQQDYLALLQKADIAAQADANSTDGIILTQAVNVASLPNFDQGMVSVQDTAAQIACHILDAKQGETILDACAAPGGKTAHLLERTDNKLQLDALDISERRVEQLHQTLERCQLTANTYVADATHLDSWPKPENGYDAILIDAPCSGTGVIRRHPDIKHHRQTKDIEQLTVIQAQLLQQLWSILKPQGRLLYMTCSVLPAENQQQIKAFLKQHDDAQLVEFSHPSALTLEHGKQTLPGIHAMDGFYYCLLQKTIS